MKLSTRTRYGMRAILELAANYGKGPLQIKIIAKRQTMSIKYLEQLMATLKSGGFIRSMRGSKGGYLLERAPNKIKISEVFTALEGPVFTVECVEDQSYCSRTIDCITRQLWSDVQDAVMGVLEAITLQDLIDRTKDDKALFYEI